MCSLRPLTKASLMSLLLPGVWDLQGTPRGSLVPSLACCWTHRLGVVIIARGEGSIIFLFLAGREAVTKTIHLCSLCSCVSKDHTWFIFSAALFKTPGLWLLRLNPAHLINRNMRMKPHFILLFEVSKGMCWRECSLPLRDTMDSPVHDGDTHLPPCCQSHPRCHFTVRLSL